MGELYVQHQDVSEVRDVPRKAEPALTLEQIVAMQDLRPCEDKEEAGCGA